MSVEVGQIFEGVVSGITAFGAFIDLPGGQTGMVHISEIADTYVKDINVYLKLNDKVRVKVLSVDEKGKISLSIRKVEVKKKTSRPAEIDWTEILRPQQVTSFEDSLSKFMKESEEKLSSIKSRESKRSRGYSRNRS